MVNISMQKIIRNARAPIIFLLATLPQVLLADTVIISDPLKLGDAGLMTLYGRLIKAFVGVVGAVALFFFVYGGILWLTSGGNDEKIKKGKETFLWATAGIAVILGSYFILSYVINTLSGVTGLPK